MGGGRSLLPHNKRKGKRGNGLNLHQERFTLGILGKTILHYKGGQALEQAAQGGGGITSPGGVSEIHRCSAWGHDLVMELTILW